MTDTHTHLYLFDEYTQGEEALRRALDAGVDMMVMPAVDHESIDALIKMCGDYPGCTRAAIGLHPTSVDEHWRENLDLILRKSKDCGCKPVAIGEIGMDLYWDDKYEKEQREAFRYQLELASEMKLPVIIHCRNALQPTVDDINSMSSKLNGVFHSFTGSETDVKLIRTAGDFYFGINGVVTYKNAADLRQALPLIGLSRIVLETDSPYLAPVPHRGKRNESAYLPHIAGVVANVLGVSIAEVIKATDENARALFPSA